MRLIWVIAGGPGLGEPHRMLDSILKPASPVERRLRSLEALVGNTPAFQIACEVDGDEYCIVAKYEIANFTGSIKDRMALHMLRCAYEAGALKPGDTIVEASSGNTGIAFAALGRALGHPVRIYMPDWMSRERRLLIEALGAEVVLVSREQGGFLGSIERADADAKSGDGVFRPRQFDNEVNIEAHYRTTGPELLAQMQTAGRSPDAFLAGVGTGGTVMGVGRYLRERLPAVYIYPLEPAESPTLRTGVCSGSHRIQGISDEFVPAIVHLDELDRVVDVHDGDAIVMAQRLASELGLGMGISSGANLLGSIKVARRIGAGCSVGTIFPDSNKKYFSTDLVRPQKPRPGSLCAEVRFRSVRVLPRLP